jgi:hypothetical protein
LVFAHHDLNPTVNFTPTPVFENMTNPARFGLLQDVADQLSEMRGRTPSVTMKFGVGEIGATRAVPMHVFLDLVANDGGQHDGGWWKDAVSVTVG